MTMTSTRRTPDRAAQGRARRARRPGTTPVRPVVALSETRQVVALPEMRPVASTACQSLQRVVTRAAVLMTAARAANLECRRNRAIPSRAIPSRRLAWQAPLVWMKTARSSLPPTRPPAPRTSSSATIRTSPAIAQVPKTIATGSASSPRSPWTWSVRRCRRWTHPLARRRLHQQPPATTQTPSLIAPAPRTSGPARQHLESSFLNETSARPNRRTTWVGSSQTTPPKALTIRDVARDHQPNPASGFLMVTIPPRARLSLRRRFQEPSRNDRGAAGSTRFATPEGERSPSSTLKRLPEGRRDRRDRRALRASNQEAWRPESSRKLWLGG